MFHTQVGVGVILASFNNPEMERANCDSQAWFEARPHRVERPGRPSTETRSANIGANAQGASAHTSKRQFSSSLRATTMDKTRRTFVMKLHKAAHSVSNRVFHETSPNLPRSTVRCICKDTWTVALSSTFSLSLNLYLFFYVFGFTFATSAATFFVTLPPGAA